jgi:5-methylthioadenosine/S-adenosylhomocysteine deaminase
MSRTLLRGADVITMAPGRPDVESVDLLVDGDHIAALGTHLNSAGAEVIDLGGRIVMPGLVNAHLHTWQTALRFIGVDWSLVEYLGNVHGGSAPRYTAHDMYVGNLAGALNQIDHGVTTIGDWCHNCITPDHADAATEGLVHSGIRAVFLHGTSHGTTDGPHDTGEVDRLLNGPIADNPLLSIGMAIKGPQLSPPEVAIADLRAAAERGIVASLHQSIGTPGPGWQAVTDADLWGPMVNIVHGTGLDAGWIHRLRDHGVSFTCTPENELGQGHCAEVTSHLLDMGAAPSLGTDTEIVSPGEVLIAVRIMLALQRNLTHAKNYQQTGFGASKASPTVKDALTWVTTEGARALGIADRVGRLQPGMQADLTIIDTRRINLWPVHNPTAAALHANADNIESVMIAGTWRKRDHALVTSRSATIRDDLNESAARLRGPVTFA